MGGDLHCHSLYSDGTCMPQELVDKAVEKGFSGISITDHDSISSFEEVYSYASAKNILCIPGVEISTEYKGISVHILGYAFEKGSSLLTEFCRVQRTRREVRNQHIIEKLCKKGFHLSMDEIETMNPGVVTYGRAHIAKAIVDKGYVQDIKSAFTLYLGDGKECYSPGVRWQVEEAINVVHDAGGKAVIAHPHLIRKKHVVDALLKMQFDGIEAYYSLANSSENAYWCKVAVDKNLFITGGSDFHGDIKPTVSFGVSWAPEETVQMLYTHFCSST